MIWILLAQVVPPTVAPNADNLTWGAIAMAAMVMIKGMWDTYQTRLSSKEKADLVAQVHQLTTDHTACQESTKNMKADLDASNTRQEEMEQRLKTSELDRQKLWVDLEIMKAQIKPRKDRTQSGSGPHLVPPRDQPTGE